MFVRIRQAEEQRAAKRRHAQQRQAAHEPGQAMEEA